MGLNVFLQHGKNLALGNVISTYYYILPKFLSRNRMARSYSKLVPAHDDLTCHGSVHYA